MGTVVDARWDPSTVMVWEGVYSLDPEPFSRLMGFSRVRSVGSDVLRFGHRRGEEVSGFTSRPGFV